MNEAHDMTRYVVSHALFTPIKVMLCASCNTWRSLTYTNEPQDMTFTWMHEAHNMTFIGAMSCASFIQVNVISSRAPCLAPHSFKWMSYLVAHSYTWVIVMCCAWYIQECRIMRQASVMFGSSFIQVCVIFCASFIQVSVCHLLTSLTYCEACRGIALNESQHCSV